jgi:hypothetical protein
VRVVTNEVLNLFWVFLEIVAALAIAVAIVWWTFPKNAKTKREQDPDNEDKR